MDLIFSFMYLVSVDPKDRSLEAKMYNFFQFSNSQIFSADATIYRNQTDRNSNFTFVFPMKI